MVQVRELEFGKDVYSRLAYHSRLSGINSGKKHIKLQRGVNSDDGL